MRAYELGCARTRQRARAQFMLRMRTYPCGGVKAHANPSAHAPTRIRSGARTRINNMHNMHNMHKARMHKSRMHYARMNSTCMHNTRMHTNALDSIHGHTHIQYYMRGIAYASAPRARSTLWGLRACAYSRMQVRPPHTRLSS